MLSSSVRRLQSYPKLNAEEKDDLIQTVDELLIWLREHQLAEQDFIRQAIIEGVEHFRFRLKRIEWLGWGYTLESLREVIGAYLALEKGTPDPKTAPNAEAILVKLSAALKVISEKVGAAKEMKDRLAFVLELYKLTSAVALPAQAALLAIGHHA